VTSGSSLQIGPQLVSTRMACPEPAGALAAAFNAALSATQSYRVEGGQLRLLDTAGATLAVLAPQATGLAGTTWRVAGYNNGRQAVVSVLGGTSLTLEFMADGRLRGSGGCNNFGSSYTLTGSQLGIGAAAATRKSCAEPEGVMDQEAAFLRALESVTSMRREGERLELRTASDALAATLVALPGPKP
jgi:heat shock protein HslJ